MERKLLKIVSKVFAIELDDEGNVTAETESEAVTIHKFEEAHIWLNAVEDKLREG